MPIKLGSGDFEKFYLDNMDIDTVNVFNKKMKGIFKLVPEGYSPVGNEIILPANIFNENVGVEIINDQLKYTQPLKSSNGRIEITKAEALKSMDDISYYLNELKNVDQAKECFFVLCKFSAVLGLIGLPIVWFTLYARKRIREEENEHKEGNGY